MKKPGHTEAQMATIAADIQSGQWLRAHAEQLAKLTRGLNAELSNFPKRARAQLISRILAAIALGDVMNEAVAEERRTKDLEEMVAAARKFLDVNMRTGVLARPILGDYHRSPKEPDKKQSALLADTAALRVARKDAFAAVRVYVQKLEAALQTARRRKRGEKRTADESGFFRTLAHRYREDLQEVPTSTPGGTFSNVVTLIREYQTGRVREDVSRIVRAALKSV